MTYTPQPLPLYERFIGQRETAPPNLYSDINRMPIDFCHSFEIYWDTLVFRTHKSIYFPDFFLEMIKWLLYYNLTGFQEPRPGMKNEDRYIMARELNALTRRVERYLQRTRPLCPKS